MGSGLLPFFQTGQSVSLNLYQASKSQNITIFWIIKMFWKYKNRIYVKTTFFCVYIIVSQSRDLIACVGLERCSRFFQVWFFYKIFKRSCVLAFKWRRFELLSCGNKEFLCLWFFGEVFANNGFYVN